MFNEVKQGIKKCHDLGKIPVSIGIDTWGVDFVLLDENDEMLGDLVCYRDKRTNGMIEKVWEIISSEDLYNATGIQPLNFNTIYQLMAVKENTPYMEKAKTLLMLPDYLHFLLTVVKKQEYTNASTTGLLNIKTKT